jgi:hypothetical protein
MPLQPGGLYCLRFYGRVDSGVSGGCIVAGTDRVNRDFRLTEKWQAYHYIFSAPQGRETSHVRLGQWQQKGVAYFDQVELLPVTPLLSIEEYDLGEGEGVDNGVYHFQADYGWEGANYHPALRTNHCGFNSDRWTFAPGDEVVYRHHLTSASQLRATLRVNINYYDHGELKISASRDAGATWIAIGVLNGQNRNGKLVLPAQLFPATEIMVRLAAAGDGASFQVNTYVYEAALDSSIPSREGKTRFLEQQQVHPDWDFNFKYASRLGIGTGSGLVYTVRNRQASTQGLQGWLQLDNHRPSSFKLGAARPGSLITGRLPLVLQSPGQHVISVKMSTSQGDLLFWGQTEIRVGILQDPRPGLWLAENRDALIYWCDSGWKIGQASAPPRKPTRSRPQPVQVSLARGEHEAVQIVINPSISGTLDRAALSSFRAAGSPDPALTGQLFEVAHVRVKQPTDNTCESGWYPDPLPPLHPPLVLRAGQTQPLWLDLRAAKGAQAGDHTGNLDLVLAGRQIRIPLRVHVYDFALPRETHLRSALGLDPHNINRYHNLTNQEPQQRVYDKYLENFAEHRISPYSFFAYDMIQVQFKGTGADLHAQLDFSRFDRAAARWLDTQHFNSFLLPLQGMGGGTFQSRHLGELAGFKEGTPEHARLFKDYLGQVEKHLRERGWLDKAYTYWFDEPDPKDYDFVVEGMKRIKAAAPGIKRMLTEQPEPALLGNVEIWCGLTPEWTPGQVRTRREAGEEVWWYICCAPKAPYVTEFIDHPGTELRLWPWQSWQYGVQGILVWATTYWTSPLVYPEPTLQDPWQDPMSYVSGYDFPPGHVGYWGNGDGRFLYPPRRNFATTAASSTEEPVNSIRWENLRDGMEDYEYFWLLQNLIQRAQTVPGSSVWIQDARQLLKIPARISQDLTHFTDDPRLMLSHRDRVARMIEKGQRLLRRVGKE